MAGIHMILVAILASGAAHAATSPIVINEIDCAEPDATAPGQFIELMNIGDKTVDLGEYTIELVDGANAAEYVYMSMNFSTTKPQIEPGGYFVMCRAETVSSLSAEVCNRFAPANLNLKFQCDKRDGARLLKGTDVVDSLSWGEYYEGLTEGANPAPRDWNTESNYSISRVPDGLDTDQNDFDFKWTCASPHRANYTHEECLCLETVCSGGKVCNPETGVCEAVVVPEDVIEDTGATDEGGTVDTASTDTATGEDTAQPDTQVADPGAPDTGVRDVGRHDSGPGIDAAHWVDLPGIVDDIGGGDGDDGDGCSAGHHTSGFAFPALLLLSTLVVLFIFRRRTQA